MKNHKIKKSGLAPRKRLVTMLVILLVPALFVFAIATLVSLQKTKGSGKNTAEASAIKEISLTQPIPPFENSDCLKAGEVIKIHEVPGSKTMVMLAVHNAGDPPDVNWGALATKEDGYVLGSEVEICYIDILHYSDSRIDSSNYTMIGLARKQSQPME